MSDAARRLAGEELGVPADAGPDAARAAFLLKLAREEFVVSERTLAALRVMGVMAPNLDQADKAEFDRALLEEFASRFWSLEPEERFRELQELKERMPSGAGRSLLHHLGSVAAIRVRDYDDAAASSLAAEARALAILPPRKRAIRRQEWLLAHNEEVFWHNAAAELLRLEPGLAECDRGLFDALADIHRNHRGSMVIDAPFAQPSFTAVPLDGAHTHTNPINYNQQGKMQPASIDPMTEEIWKNLDVINAQYIKQQQKELLRLGRPKSVPWHEQELSRTLLKYSPYLFIILITLLVKLISATKDTSQPSYGPLHNRKYYEHYDDLDKLKFESERANRLQPYNDDLFQKVLSGQGIPIAGDDSFWRLIKLKPATAGPKP